MIPVQVLSYYFSGGIMFSYLKNKGNLDKLTHRQMTRISLEINFVNHIIPSGGAVGFSYLAYELKRHGVSISRSTIAQVVKHVLMFASFIMLLIISVIVLAIDQQVGRYVFVSTAILTVLAIAATALVIYLFSDNKRLQKLSGRIRRIINSTVNFVTRGKKPKLIDKKTIDNFFEEMHHDYLAIKRDKKTLYSPFVWSILANVLDVALLWIAFWSFGVALNPAVLFIAFGVSSIAGAVTVTPGGAGVYEAVMIAFLASAGVPQETAIAGTLLARVILLAGTIIFGYTFYQRTINSYGKPTN
jgi:uncharacterized protein (TIRG00374 family)